MRLRAGGTHVGAFRGIASTRRDVNVTEFSFYRVTNGRIVEFTGTGDADILDRLRGDG